MIFGDWLESSDEDAEDEMQLVNTAAACFFYSFCSDGRADAQKEHERVIKSDWWESIDSMQHDMSGEFKRTFRISRSRFGDLVEIVSSKWQSVHGIQSFLCASRVAGGIRRKVAVAMHFLSIESGIRVTAQIFGISIATAWDNVKKVCAIIVQNSHQFIYLRRDFVTMSQEFEAIAQFPDVVGAVDGSHILLNRPENWKGMYNRKGVVSLNMQGVVDAKGRFMNISIRHGSVNDKSLWSSSQFGAQIQEIIPSWSHVLGDSIYMLRPWMLIPYDTESKDSSERNYNYRHSVTRIVVERSFGILKGRWRCLKHLRVHGIESAAMLIEVCVCMHNFAMEDETEQDWNVWYEPDVLLASRMCAQSNESLKAGCEKREIVRNYLSTLPLINTKN